MSIRKCDGCEFLNKKRKTKPCDKDFKSIYDTKSGIYKRPNNCKIKQQKINPQKQLKKLKEEAIDLFQTYIRYRDNFKCVCCGFSISAKDKDAKKLIHGGHFISRKITNLLLDEKNCFAQCRTCNYLQDKVSVNPQYIIFLIKKFGIEIFDYYYNKIFSKEKVERDLEYWKKQRDYWKKKLDKEVERYNVEHK